MVNTFSEFRLGRFPFRKKSRNFGVNFLEFLNGKKVVPFFTNFACVEVHFYYETSMITDRIGRHEVLLPINQKNYNFREKRIPKL